MPILFPAIDLKDGACVRLKLGVMDDATVYNDDPAAQARAFRDAGFTHLHIVDLDGAFAGRAINASAVEAIVAAVGGGAVGGRALGGRALGGRALGGRALGGRALGGRTEGGSAEGGSVIGAAVTIQLGGGIRSMDDIERWLGKGIDRVILGTIAVRDPALVIAAARAHPGRIAVGIDAKGGKVAVEGWAETSRLAAVDLAKRFEDAGVAAIIYTDIDRDGVLAGINWDATIDLAEAVSIPVIASGGLASLADVVRLTMPDAQKLEGAISGRALYDGRIDAKEALAVLSGDRG